MFEYNLHHYAHLGDAVFELFARENCAPFAYKTAMLHKLTTKFVCASFQTNLICKLEEHLSEEEKEIVRRGRNLKITVNKRNNPKIHSAATAFETLIGYLYINNKQRLNEIFEIIKKNLICELEGKNQV